MKMEKLSLFQHETLEILKQLEYCCERFEVYNPGGKLEDKFLWISFGDIDFTVLKKGEHIHDIEQYLQKNGVDFHITFDLENEFPDMYIDREHPNDDFIELGKINGESIQDIKTRIEKLITELNPEEKIKKVENILEEKKDKNTLKFDFPETIQWDYLVLKIKDGLEDIEIYYKDKHIAKASYIELGFSANKTNHKPNRAWKLLTMLSVLQHENITEATPDNLKPMFETYIGYGIKKDNIYQIKKLLSDALKAIFKTEEDPFTDKKEYYEPKFKILPEPELREEEIWSSRLKNNESQEPREFMDNGNENLYDKEDPYNEED